MGQGIPQIWGFLLQAFVLLSYIPMTFVAYRLLREPRKYQRTRWELSQFDMEGTPDLKEALHNVEYSLAQYIHPLGYIILIFLALYSMTNPYIISLGIWKGLLEDIVDVFGRPATGSVIPLDILVGRFMFWCWLGAYIYSVDRTIRHYLAHDLTPNVYITIAKRFTVAFVVGSLMGLAIGASNRLIHLSFDNNLVSVYIVCFFIGLFPETGIKWINRTAEKILHLSTVDNDQLPLSKIDGISNWHQGRLDQEGIENLQNLASANLLALVAKTPFDVGQLVDWVDQAVLLMHTSPEQSNALEKAGLRHASAVLAAIQTHPVQLKAAAGISLEELQLLSLNMKSATNIGLIDRYRAHLLRLEIRQPELPEDQAQPLPSLDAAVANPVSAQSGI
jgi:hypothetical protein